MTTRPPTRILGIGCLAWIVSMAVVVVMFFVILWAVAALSVEGVHHSEQQEQQCPGPVVTVTPGTPGEAPGVWCT
jgi:hypothetical protein